MTVTTSHTPAADSDPSASPVEADSAAPATAEEVISRLRGPAQLRQIFGGFGPLVLAAVLLLAIILLAPSVAPERVVERPVETTVEEGR